MADLDLTAAGKGPYEVLAVFAGTPVSVVLPPRKLVTVQHLNRKPLKVTAGNNPAAGAGVTVQLSNTGNLANGQKALIEGGGNSEVVTVSNLVSNTSFECDLSNSYTAPSVTWIDGASGAGDRLVLQHGSATAAAHELPGTKLVLAAGAERQVVSGAVRASDGTRTLQLNAEANAVLVQLVVGEPARLV